MINKECFTTEWISAKSKEFGYPDRNIIEKVIRAFSLLDMLAASGCPFHFKGGSCLMLLLTDQPYRLSGGVTVSTMNLSRVYFSDAKRNNCLNIV